MELQTWEFYCENHDKLREACWKYRQEYPISFKGFTQKVGISEGTLRDFMRDTRVSTLKTRAMIFNFLQKVVEDTHAIDNLAVDNK